MYLEYIYRLLLDISRLAIVEYIDATLPSAFAIPLHTPHIHLLLVIMSTTTATPRDPTFRIYAPDQATTYAKARGSYPSVLYDAILSHHLSTGGSTNLLLDVGCGPGNATRDLSPQFEHVIGVDPGVEMITTARKMGGKTKSGREVRFEVSGAEEISSVEGLEEGSVDLLIGAMAVSGSALFSRFSCSEWVQQRCLKCKLNFVILGSLVQYAPFLG